MISTSGKTARGGRARNTPELSNDQLFQIALKVVDAQESNVVDMDNMLELVVRSLCGMHNVMSARVLRVCL